MVLGFSASTEACLFGSINARRNSSQVAQHETVLCSQQTERPLCSMWAPSKQLGISFAFFPLFSFLAYKSNCTILYKIFSKKIITHF